MSLFGTQTTNTSLARIASQFATRQQNCQAQPGGADCQITDSQGDQVSVSIDDDPQPIIITAMSLPWGASLILVGRTNFLTASYGNRRTQLMKMAKLLI